MYDNQERREGGGSQGPGPIRGPRLQSEVKAKSAVYKLQFDALLGSTQWIFSNCCLPDTSNMEYDSGIHFSVFPFPFFSIFKLIFVHKSFEVHYKSEYKTSRKL